MVPTQNFFKCLIFPPLASFLQAPSHLFVHRFFIPLQPMPPPPFCLLPAHLPPFLLALPQHRVCISPISRCSVLLLMQTDLYFINLFELVALVIWGQVMAFTESPLWPLNSFPDICSIQTQLPAHPSCPICAATFPPTCFPFLQTVHLTLLSSSVF